MKTTTKNSYVFLKSIFVKALVITAFFALAWTSKSQAQSVFARVEYQNWQVHQSPGQTYYTVDVYLRYYEDFWCTSPASCPVTADLTLTQSYYDTYTGSTTNPQFSSLVFTASANTTETLVQQGAIMQSENYFGDYYYYESRYYYWDNYSDANGSVYMGAWNY